MSRGKGRARTRELSESWASLSYAEDQDLGQSSSQDSDAPSHKDVQRAKKSSARNSPPPQSSGKARSATPSTPVPRNPPKRRVSQPSAELEFVMPSSPDGSFGGSPMHSSRRPRRVSQSIAEDDESADLRQRKRRSRTMQRVSSSEDKIDASTPLGLLWANVLGPISSYLLSVLCFTLNVLKPLFSIALAVAFVAAFLSFARYWITTSVSTALTPICTVPGVSFLNLPFCNYPQRASPTSAGSVEFDELVKAQQAFEEIISDASRYDGLPADMKRGETAIRDLRSVVRYSKLPSKSELDMEFHNFIEKAGKASWDLTRFNSRIGSAVDKMLSTNKWTLRVIDDIKDAEDGRGSVDRFIWDQLLWVISPHRNPRERLVSQYLTHTQKVEDEITTLIDQADALLGILDSLESHLGAIHEISVRDDVSLQGKREELFLDLWTKLGGNRSNVKKLDQQIQLLKNVNMYRRTAVSHVSSTMVKLRAIAVSLEDMRERAATPDVVGVDGEVPIVLHIENIQRGLDRLEAQRLEHQRSVDERHRRILDAAEASDANSGAGVPESRMID
ncbi:hypothetical protein BFW01_g6818 [Lasiodiplodia theobromae]|uniref:uncharacterized protein n=1 Tax=Lasiodiplodia theobromae TaxID=45133 RepID=UPI0015C30BEB|nr:uncharacterized protein LTHEOB_7654 [Lasiodiplodia theobromae]KAF4542462.1 hypothetical protein LTHEOB_7654 [Lasiodiplodia theobromae]KAF9635923.1 hypothetical protein BFW01_g6818 [Lasiodiplodia theobromae]